MENRSTPIPLKLRLGTMLVDHIIMSFAMVPLMALFMPSTDEPFQDPSIGRLGFYLGFFIYINKDFFKGKSLAKRILGFQIVDRKTGQPASELQCVIRNMLIPIWPLEVIITVFSRKRRIGDLIANTQLEITEGGHARTILTDIRSTKLTPTMAMAIVVGIIYVSAVAYGMSGLLP